EQTEYTAQTAVLGVPEENAKLQDRELRNFLIMSPRYDRLRGHGEGSPVFIAELFAAIDARFFVYLAKEHDCNDTTGNIMPGEPLLVDLARDRGIKLLRANGEVA